MERSLIIGPILAVVIFIAIMLIVTICNFSVQKEIKVEDIIRVFMNRPTEFTFMIQDLDSGNLLLKTYRVEHEEDVRIISDVLQENKIWMAKKRLRNGTGTLEIHVHSFKDLEGGGWDSGKFGHGKVHIIE